ncbi:hypothetical protein OAO01_04775 [Oligoflexia bacterium]|nr:hypothetical protein [Oligoflexia bacterium]
MKSDHPILPASMTAIFYDLETTDTNPIGQILNYCFIETDDNFNTVSELVGEIAISRTQLPRAGAILANRIDVTEHQKQDHPPEHIAMETIADYLQGIIDKAQGRIPLIGYNSARFDLPYLRTSFLRNGVNPYFFGKLTPRDLFFVVQKLSATCSDFPRPERANCDEKRLSLKLESITKHLGLLEGKQTHESRDDVLLTIKLAQKIEEKFGVDVRTYMAYEVAGIHKKIDKGDIITVLWPNYDVSSAELAVAVPMALLDATNFGALWIDLERYQAGKGRASLKWFNVSGSLFVKGPSNSQAELKEVASKAIKEFGKITLDNFFETSVCDIEQDIYRLHPKMNFSGLEALHAAIWKGRVEKLSKLKDRVARVLFRRFELVDYKWGSGQDVRIRELLIKYANYRYGGELLLSKSAPSEDATEEERAKRYHLTLKELVEEVDTELKEASPADKKLLNSLKKYYLASDIYDLAGEMLEKLPEDVAEGK